MRVKQISVFLENKTGRLAQVSKALGDYNIDIRALSIADTTDFGILRLIVNAPDKAYQVLNDKGFTVSCTEVIAVEVSDEPGGLHNSLKALDNVGINIEYMYAFLEKASNAALVVFRVEKLDEAIKVLQDNGFHVLEGERVYSV
ncbi:MAG: ACT domain-containing protein [Clostridiales bacterium]|nr:ACT domain-containing protein [Clostridiales bacterium]MCF8022076.1 ACT domain-containing protein [Clostridiales bacterium]